MSEKRPTTRILKRYAMATSSEELGFKAGTEYCRGACHPNQVCAADNAYPKVAVRG